MKKTPDEGMRMHLVNLVDADGTFVSMVEVPEEQPRLSVVRWSARLFLLDAPNGCYREVTWWDADKWPGNQHFRSQNGEITGERACSNG